MSENPNLTRLKAAYQAWHDSKGASQDVWLDLLHDNVALHTMGEEAAGLSFCEDCRCKQDVVAYMSGLLETWTMIHFTPETYVCQDDDIAMFGRCAWQSKATGRDVEVSVAHLWTFQDGKVAKLREIFDSARAAAAAAA